MTRILTIDRSKWRRGRLGIGASELLNSAGYLCCLGFDALACGLHEDDIRGRGLPEELDDPPRDYSETRLDGPGSNSYEVSIAVEHNDDKDLAEDAREHLIRLDLIALGWDDVVFVDGTEACR